jgi:hypothetical protein
MAAKIMDPAIGASTWALGSHKWKPYTGILMVNASRQNNHHKVVSGRDRSDRLVLILIVGIVREKEKEYKAINAINSGRDPARV